MHLKKKAPRALERSSKLKYYTNLWKWYYCFKENHELYQYQAIVAHLAKHQTPHRTSYSGDQIFPLHTPIYPQICNSSPIPMNHPGRIQSDAPCRILLPSISQLKRYAQAKATRCRTLLEPPENSRASGKQQTPDSSSNSSKQVQLLRRKPRSSS